MISVIFQNVFAATGNAVQNRDTYKVQVYGNAGAEYCCLPLTVSIKDANGGIKDIKLICTDTEGEFYCEFVLDDNKYTYTVSVNSVKSKIKVEDFAVDVYASDEIQMAFKAFLDAADYIKMQECVSSYGEILGFKANLLKDITNADAFYGLLSEKRNVSTVAEAQQIFTDTAICAIINSASEQNICSLLESYADTIGIINSRLYEKYLTIDKIHFAKAMKNTVYSSTKDILNGFDIAVALTSISKSQYYVDTEKYITDNAEILGIDLKQYNKLSKIEKSNVMKLLTGVQFCSKEELNEKFNIAVSNPSGKIENDKTGNAASGGSTGNGKGIGNISTTTPSENIIPKEVSFVDLNDVFWAKNAITELANKKIINGKKEFYFYPNDNITRAEFVKILCGVFNFAKNADVDDFIDVSKDDWEYDYVSAAVNAGVVNGISKNEFSPSLPITRQDMVTMVVRALIYGGYSVNKAQLLFYDSDEISEYAKDAVAAAAYAGIVNGTGSGYFEPYSYATRAEAAKTLYEVMIKFNTVSGGN